MWGLGGSGFASKTDDESEGRSCNKQPICTAVVAKSAQNWRNSRPIWIFISTDVVANGSYIASGPSAVVSLGICLGRGPSATKAVKLQAITGAMPEPPSNQLWRYWTSDMEFYIVHAKSSTYFPIQVIC